MRLGVVVLPSAATIGPDVQPYMISLARQAEALGFHGIWVTDAFARGRATLDPLILLAVMAAHTSRIELGTCVVQLPLRHPVEHAQRVQSLQALSAGRLRFGVGSGSTASDFEAVQADYAARFRTLTRSLEVMREVWAEKPVFGPALSMWPGTQGGPPVLLGAWRSQRWIDLSAKVLQGWIASGIHTSWEDLNEGVGMYRKAGGTRAVLANIITDLRDTPAPLPIPHQPKINLLCPKAEARDRLKKLEDMGVDDALLACPSDDPRQLDAIASLIG